MREEHFHVGQRLIVEIDGVGTAGEGVGHTKGRAIFVPGSILGEKLKVEIKRTGARGIWADPIEVMDASPDRQQPSCPVFGHCGGCQLLHMSYPCQLRFKARVLADTMRSIAKINDCGPMVIDPAQQPFGYRHHVQMPVAWQSGKAATGFYAAKSHRVVAVSECRLLEPRLQAAITGVRDWASERLGRADHRFSKTHDWLNRVVARVGSVSGNVLVWLMVAREQSADTGTLAQELRERVPNLVGLMQSLDLGKTHSRKPAKARLLWGQDFIEERMLQLSFRLSPASFFQIHPAQAEALFSRALDFVGRPDGPVVDAYCGVGVLALALARRGVETVGIESGFQAVAEAKAAATQNGIDNVRFVPGQVELELPRLLKEGLRPSAVILDPPRSGCDRAVLEALAASGCEKIAYISCNPGTLARDLGILTRQGYRLAEIRGVDMFPQTAHLEVFAGLIRNT